MCWGRPWSNRGVAVADRRWRTRALGRSGRVYPVNHPSMGREGRGEGKVEGVANYWG